MRIAIVSDTHGNIANFKKIIDWLNNEKIGLILHCGDIGSPESLKESLAGFQGEFLGVLGNVDKYHKKQIEEYQEKPKIKVFEEMLEKSVEGKKIAVVHKSEPAKVLAESGKYDLVFYGHTHKPWEDKVGECRMINPGETAGQYNKPTFAVYNTDSGQLELKILEKL